MRDRSGQAVYNVSFLLADHLIQRHRLGSLTRDFRLCADGSDRSANFAQVLAYRLDELEREVMTGAGAASTPLP